MKVNVLKGFAGPGVRLAVVSVFLLGVAGVAHAQAYGAAAQATTKAAAATGQGKAEPVTAAPGKRAPKGNHEGITVHGHWTIEVRNPDGKVVSHTEFENSLQAFGATLLGYMLTGEIVPGGYEVLLGSGALANTTGPCQPSGANGATACVLVGSLISPTPASFSDQTGVSCPGTPGQCFPLTIAANSTGFTVSGTAISYAPSGAITDVFLDPLTCPTIGVNTGLRRAVHRRQRKRDKG